MSSFGKRSHPDNIFQYIYIYIYTPWGSKAKLSITFNQGPFIVVTARTLPLTWLHVMRYQSSINQLVKISINDEISIIKTLRYPFAHVHNKLFRYNNACTSYVIKHIYYPHHSPLLCHVLFCLLRVRSWYELGTQAHKTNLSSIILSIFFWLIYFQIYENWDPMFSGCTYTLLHEEKLVCRFGASFLNTCWPVFNHINSLSYNMSTAQGHRDELYELESGSEVEGPRFEGATSPPILWIYLFDI